MRTRRLACMFAIPLAILLLSAALPTVLPVVAQEEETRPEPRQVEIPLEGGEVLIAQVYEPKGGGETKPAVVALHGQGGSRAMWEAAGAFLAEQRVSLLAVDLRGHGDSVSAGGDGALGRVAAGDPAFFAAMREDALAAVAYARETLLADGRKIALVGSGAGASVALQAAKRDDSIAAVLCLEPDPAACGIPVLDGLNKWDGRPVGLLCAGKTPPAGMKKLARVLAKQPRTETIVVSASKATGVELVAQDSDTLLEAAQWLVGWLQRPELDGKPHLGNVRQSQGPGHIVAATSSQGFGMGGAGGLNANGYQAPGKIDGVMLMVHPDPEAKKLTKQSRRLTLTKGKAKKKALAVNVKIETWSGKSWKKLETLTLRDCGGFAQEANLACYEIWLSPRILGVKPFSKVAVTSCLARKGKPTWKDEEPFKGTDLGSFGGPRKERKLFKINDPSTWSAYDLN